MISGPMAELPAAWRARARGQDVHMRHPSYCLIAYESNLRLTFLSEYITRCPSSTVMISSKTSVNLEKYVLHVLKLMPTKRLLNT